MHMHRPRTQHRPHICANVRLTQTHSHTNSHTVWYLAWRWSISTGAGRKWVPKCDHKLPISAYTPHRGTHTHALIHTHRADNQLVCERSTACNNGAPIDARAREKIHALTVTVSGAACVRSAWRWTHNCNLTHRHRHRHDADLLVFGFDCSGGEWLGCTNARIK